MLTRKKSIKSRSRQARRKQTKFLTPDLALFRGQKLRFVAGPDNALSEAEGLRGEYAEMENDHQAAVRQCLQRIYGLAARFRRQRGDFKRFQAHPFWKQTRQKPKDPSTTKWVLYFIMQATTTHVRNRASKYAAILDGLMRDQMEVSAVASRIKELGGINAAYEAMRVQKRRDAQVSGKVAVAETAAAGRRTRRDHERSSSKIGGSPMFTTDLQIRRRGRKSTLRPYPLVANLFAEEEIKPPDKLIGDDLLCVGEGEGGSSVVRVPREAAFDLVHRLAGEYAKIKDGDHKSIKRVLRRAYLAALKMQHEPAQFERLKVDPFWNTSLHKPNDASTSKWVLFFIMQARTPNVRHLAGKYVAILDGFMRDEVSHCTNARIGEMEGVEAAYEAWQARKRLRGLTPWSRRQGGNG